MNAVQALIKRYQLASVLVLTLLLAIVLPLSLDIFRLNLVGKYLTYAFVAVGLVMVWGYGGVLSIGQQGYTGGVNGMTDLKTVLGWDTRTDHAKYILYYLCVALLIASILLCRWIQTGKAGTLLLAMRDKEDRVRFSGYDVANFRVFTLSLAAALAGIGGSLFSLPVGFMAPSSGGIAPSVETAIFASLCARMRRCGAA